MSPGSGEEVRVEVDGRTLKLSNLDKVLYPRTGTTKGEVLNYYAQASPALLPLLADRLCDPRALAQRRGEAELLREEHPHRHALVGAHGRGADDRLAGPASGRARNGDVLVFPVIDDLADVDLAGQPRRARAARAPVDGDQGGQAAEGQPDRDRPRPGRRRRPARVLPGRPAGARQARRAGPGDRGGDQRQQGPAPVRRAGQAAGQPTTPPPSPRRSPRSSRRSTAGWSRRR